jgi:hypothetical protein
MIMPRSADVLADLVISSCTELFAAYGVALDRKQASVLAVKPARPEASAGGMVNFSGPLVSGSLLLVAPFAFLAECRPGPLRTQRLAMSSSSDWILVRDWSMELANQLVGRLRNRLYDHDVTIDVRGPTAVSAHPLAMTIGGRKGEPVQFVTPQKHLVRVWMDATTSPGFDAAMARKPVTPGASAKEGDVLLF